MNTNIKRKMTEALEDIASRNCVFDGWLVCYHRMYHNITFSIYKTDMHNEEKTITLQGVNFFIYEGTEESDILPIAHKIIKEIEEIDL